MKKKLLLILILLFVFTIKADALIWQTQTAVCGETDCVYDDTTKQPTQQSIECGCPTYSENDGSSGGVENDTPDKPGQDLDEWVERHSDEVSGYEPSGSSGNGTKRYQGTKEVDSPPAVGENFCSEENILKALKVVGTFLFIAKIMVPVIIAIMGMIDFIPAVTSGDQSEITKRAQKLATRILIGLIIFFIPTILNVFLYLLGNAGVMKEYDSCRECLLQPFKCTP